MILKIENDNSHYEIFDNISYVSIELGWAHIYFDNELKEIGKLCVDLSKKNVFILAGNNFIKLDKK